MDEFQWQPGLCLQMFHNLHLEGYGPVVSDLGHLGSLWRLVLALTAQSNATWGQVPRAQSPQNSQAQGGVGGVCVCALQMRAPQLSTPAAIYELMHLSNWT